MTSHSALLDGVNWDWYTILQHTTIEILKEEVEEAIKIVEQISVELFNKWAP